ncbi:zinc finger protein 862-like [Hydractinia symbiolongicarpus]|uniref:zinc finger protein 862-like n=1 Tax=Hydractinia symbiolongicarpus TaxID=13093 RepID=UPI0025508A62|nr:zinc finger protein 862-like [Hydractinia symbiolongicarpus]
MSEYGGTDAESLRNGIDGIFNQEGFIPFKPEDYRLKMIGCTSDGASVNFGRKSGLMTRLSETRPWLVKIHCSNHRVELAVKDAFKTTAFQQVDEFYISNFNLLKNSRKIKTEIKAACHALNIQHHTLSKLTGTRFIGHRRAAYKKLLAIWPAIQVAYENVVADPKTRAETRATVQGYLKKINSYQFLCLVCTYADVLEIITPASKIFEAEHLMAYDAWPAIEETLNNLTDTIHADMDEEMLVSHLASFRMEDGQLKSSFYKGDDSHKENANKQRITIELKNFTYLNEDSVNSAIGKKKDVCNSLKELLEAKFADFQEPVLKSMIWFDCRRWPTDDKSFGFDKIKEMYFHFKQPLDFNGYDEVVALCEWRSLRSFVKANHSGEEPLSVWKTVLTFKRTEFPNLCMLAELVLCLSASNSTVERAFSLLTLLLSNRRLTMSHVTMENLLCINLNNKIWTEKEREEITEMAVIKYLEKRRKKKCITWEPPHKKSCSSSLDVTTISSSDNEDSNSDDDDSSVVVFSDSE